jgi:hypothetical protein
MADGESAELSTRREAGWVQPYESQQQCTQDLTRVGGGGLRNKLEIAEAHGGNSLQEFWRDIGAGPWRRRGGPDLLSRLSPHS